MRGLIAVAGGWLATACGGPTFQQVTKRDGLHGACEWASHEPARQTEFWRARAATASLRVLPLPPLPSPGVDPGPDLLVELTIAGELGGQVRIERLRLDGWDSSASPPPVHIPPAIARVELEAKLGRASGAGGAAPGGRAPGAAGAAADAVVAIATLPVLVLGAVLEDLARDDADAAAPAPTLDELRAASDPVEFAAWQREREIEALVADASCTPTQDVPCVFRLRLARAAGTDAPDERDAHDVAATLRLGLTVEHPESYGNWPAACTALGRTFELPPMRVAELGHTPRTIALAP